MARRRFLASAGLAAVGLLPRRGASAQEKSVPNFVFILTDDQRFDALGCANPLVITPNMDAMAARGVRFARAFVATSICSPSRACCLTGRYGRANGVPGLGMGLKPAERTFAQILKAAGYQTGYVGKWHLSRPADPSGAGFDFVTYFNSNGPHHDRKVIERGQPKVAKGFIEDYLAGQAVEFLEAAAAARKPFLLHLATQIPHMDDKFDWPARPETLALYDEAKMPVPANWRDDLSGKPPYLKAGRHRERGTLYGYGDAAGIRRHFRRYFAAVTDLDRALGALLAALDRLGLRETTYIVHMGDNGWFMGEHGFTSKVLAYEESMRVPFLVSGPGLKGTVCDELILNADIAPTLLDLAGLPIPENMHGRSLVPLLKGQAEGWRKSVLYEAIKPELGSWPILAVRTSRWKYIQTFKPPRPDTLAFEELYDLENDPGEMRNLAAAAEHKAVLEDLKAQLASLVERVKS
ncbi:MAG TPA: sulfatase-like hydrolase/transferase [Planctomycetota bacterium]|nr:sulfatase-like hydrolase/transferase [Planctomycetota bacterium]